MDDLISRQAVIEMLDETRRIAERNIDGAVLMTFEKVLDSLVNITNALPNIQPEIIRCKDCKHFIREDIEEYAPYGFYNTYFHAFCDKHWDKEQGEYIDVNLDDYCSFAERREVTT